LADIEAAQRAADEQARADAARRADEAALAQRERALAARENAQQQTIARRENMMALAAVLLAIAALTGGAAVLGQSRGNLQHARRFGGVAGLLLLGAVIVFALRPSFPSIGPQGLGEGNNAAVGDLTDARQDGSGKWLCRFEPEFSRVTISDTADLSFGWAEQGCVDGRTQFLKGQEGWTRILVPTDDAAISVRYFDPVIGRYRTDNYLIDAETAEQAKSKREQIGWSGCAVTPAQLSELAAVQNELQGLLPARPNERLVYRCERAGGAPTPRAALP